MVVVRSGAATVVLTVLDVAALVSPPPITPAVLALTPVVVGLTAMVIVAVPLMAMAALLVQVTFCPLAVQVKPLPLTKLKPAGKVSATVTVPLVAAVPVLVTTRV